MTVLEFEQKTLKSRELYDHALRILPAGVSYRLRLLEPYPFYVDSARGSKVIDVDGNEYTDYWCNHFAAILGHSHPRVKDAIERQLDKGWDFGLVHELEIRHAELIKRHVPSAEMIRYSSSGTEANMYATRVARVFTKRSLIGKFEGGWHGGYDALERAIKPPFDVLPTGGLTPGILRDTITLPYNDLDGTRKAIRRKKLAAIFAEAVQGVGGMIPADPEFLKGLRELCDETGTLLVFDEVITGFRLGLGGGQGYFRVKPDLTVFGKIIGGGLPIGAIAGRSDIMEHMDHRKYSGGDFCFQGGTYAASVLTLAAGEATIHTLQDEPVYDKIDRLGERTRTRLSDMFTRLGFNARVTGIGSVFGIHFTKKKNIRDSRHLSKEQAERGRRLFASLLKNGIVLLATDIQHGCVSYSHKESEIDTLVASVEDFVKAEGH